MSRVGPMHASVIDPDAIDKATIKPGVIGIEVCPACGRALLAVNRRLIGGSCFLGHPETNLVYFVAIPAHEVISDLPDQWKPIA